MRSFFHDHREKSPGLWLPELLSRFDATPQEGDRNYFIRYAAAWLPRSFPANELIPAIVNIRVRSEWR